MPSPAVPSRPSHHNRAQSAPFPPLSEESRDNIQRVQTGQGVEDAVTELHRALTREPSHQYPEAHLAFDDFLQEENRALEQNGVVPARLGVCFKDLTTWGTGSTHTPVKTFKHALWRTLTGQDIYEWTIGRVLSKSKPEDGRPLIQNFSGVVRGGEIMLVLGRPGSGCSTFLRTVANDHSSYHAVTGSLNYSGLTPQEISTNYRGQVTYVPEEDDHFPTLTVRQTLEFALQSKTPKRCQDDIPRYLEIFARVFGISHVLESLVGNEYVRGVSGGERKRISIIESLASDSSVVAWDNSTRGLDAASALDYARSLRIMTDTCGKATIVSLYQVSDAVFALTDKVLLIDEGRMIYQGPSKLAKKYFESLGYESQARQTTADFLASITSVSERRFRPGWESRTPKGAEALERAFRSSSFFQDLQSVIREYEAGLKIPTSHSRGSSIVEDAETFKQTVKASKSRYAPRKSSYTISFPRQVYICTKRQMWQLKGNSTAFFVKTGSTIFNALMIGSMFYDQPETTEGAFSRGGFIFYSAVLLGWIQLAELEEAIQGRNIISRQKRFAFVAPSAVSFARVLVDLVVVLVQALLYSAIAYFLAGMQQLPGRFFLFILFIYTITICMTAQFRFIGSISPNFEVAIRYCGVLLLLYIVFGGYLISTENLLSNVPWFGWILYTLPLTYTYEAMMAAEFHGLNLACSPRSIIPEGSNYTYVKYQSCAIAGSTPGFLSVSGDSYIAASFGYFYSNVWRNFGIMILFTFAFIFLGALFNETLEWNEGRGGALEFKSAKNSNNRSAGKDEEEKPVQALSTPMASSVGSFDKDAATVPHLETGKSTFTWKDLTYSIPYDSASRTLLNGVSGYCTPGHMTALVGSSGAGKTTLLNTLAQRQRVGQLSGDMMLGGQPLGHDFQKMIGFVEQMDIHDESSTIKEAFEFSALLRQPAHIPRQEKIVYAERMLEMLDLVELQDAIIWSLPLEQKKRTTIGVELCAKPTSLLFLDEPTSGLDGQGALNILNLLRRLASAGQSILCTIHQATQEQFTLFDNVLALNPGGNTFYFGSIGDAGETIFDYFACHGIPVEDGKNVADFLIEVGVGVLKSGDNPDLDFNQVWRDSPQAILVQQEIQELSRHKNCNTSSTEKSSHHSEFSASTWQQIVTLTKRISRQYWRTPEYPYSRLYASFLHAILNGFTFFQLGKSITDMQSRMFACFLILMLVPEFMNATSMRFIANRDIWESREYPSRIYGWVAFSVAQILSELPYAFFGSVIFFVLFYFPVGLPLGVPAVYTFFMVMFFYLFATSWGQWVGALSKNATVAANLMPFLVIMCELFNGILRPQSQMPAFWKYTMYYVAPFTYWIGGILVATLSGRPIVCSEQDLNFFDAPVGLTCAEYAGEWLRITTGYLIDGEALGSCGYCKYSVADEYLAGLNLDSSKSWPYFCIFCAFVISNVIIVLALMKFYTWRNFGRKERR